MPAELDPGKRAVQPRALSPRAKQRSLARTISARYPTPFLRHYTYWKIVTDPVYAAVWDVLADAPSLPLLDLGCGGGQFAFFIRECGYTAPLAGVELDAEKVEIASRIAAAHHLDARFLAQDYRDIGEDHQGHVCLLDVLQYVPPDAQREMLARAARLVHQHGGLFIARSGLRDDSMRYHITRMVDRFARAIRWIRAPLVDHPARETFEEVLGAAGLKVECRPLWGRTPFNNHLIIARRA